MEVPTNSANWSFTYRAYEQALVWIYPSSHDQRYPQPRMKVLSFQLKMVNTYAKILTNEITHINDGIRIGIITPPVRPAGYKELNDKSIRYKLQSRE